MAVPSSGLGWCWLVGRGGGPVGWLAASFLGWWVSRCRRGWGSLGGPPRSSPPACWSGSAPRPPRATGSPRAASAPERSRLAAGHPAGTRGTERSEYRSGLDGAGGEVAARLAGKRPGPVGAGSRRPAQRGGRSAPAGLPCAPVHGRRSGSASAARPRGRCSRRSRVVVQDRPARQARRCKPGLGQWASATATSSPTSTPWRGPSRTRAAVASWSPSRAAAATASRSRCPAGAGPGGCGCMAVRLAAGVIGGRLDGQMPPQAGQGALGGSLGLDPGAGTRQDLCGPPGPGQGHQGVGACPVAVADGGAGHHQVLEAAPGDVPGLALAGLLHRARLDPGPLPDPGRAVPGRPLWVEPPGLLDHLDHPGGPQQGLGVGHGVDEQPARAGPDQAALLGLIPEPVGATGRTGRGRSRRPGPARRAGWRPRGPRRWPRTRQRRGWRPRPGGACGGWRSGRSPPATAAWQASASSRPAR